MGLTRSRSQTQLPIESTALRVQQIPNIRDKEKK